MLVIGGKATGTENVLAETEIQTLYRRSMVEVYALADNAAAAAPSLQASYKSGKTVLMDGVYIPTTDAAAYTGGPAVGPGMPGTLLYSGMVPAGQQQLKLAANVFWLVKVHDA